MIKQNDDLHQRDTNERLMYSAIDIIKSQGFLNIRAGLSDFEKPAKLTKKGTEKSYIPHITARTTEGKHYFEIVTPSSKNPKELIDKWMLLSSMAEHKNGTFFLLVPNGKLSFTKRILEQYPIHANILKMK